MKTTPLLILSDSVSASSGLARITRELALRIHRHIPEYRVATLGYGGSGSIDLPWQQYYAVCDDWMPLDLPNIWQDFTKGQKGILMTIWDPARVGWIGQAENPEFGNHPLCKWIRKANLKKWLYAPVDAEGPNGKFSAPLKDTILGFDRVLFYSEWAKAIAERSGIANTEAIPHGIDSSVFYPRLNAREHFGRHVLNQPWHIKEDEYLIGVVGTNQPRKDWHLAVHTAAILRDKFEKNVVLWLHTDALERFWSLPTLLIDYGFIGASKPAVFVTTQDLSDEQMAWGYSACDVTLGIGLGEGFGFPIFESLACGTPVMHCNYGGAAEHMPRWMLDDSDGLFRHEGLYACKRPVPDPEYWAGCISQFSPEFGGIELPPRLDWNNLWKNGWEPWFRKGLCF